MQPITTSKTFALILAISFSILSCKKDKESEATTIVGTWSVRSYIITNFENEGVDIDDTKGKFPRPIFNFDNNGVFTSTLETPSAHTTSYVLKDSKVTLGEDIAFNHNWFNYTFTGKVLTLTRTDKFQNARGSYTENTAIILDRQ